MRLAVYLVSLSFLVGCAPPLKLLQSDITVASSIVDGERVLIQNYKQKPYTGLVYVEEVGPDGEFVSSERNLKEGVLHGVARDWYTKGLLKKETVYQNGGLVSLKQWQTNKTLIKEATYDPGLWKTGQTFAIEKLGLIESKRWSSDGKLIEEMKQTAPGEIREVQHGSKSLTAYLAKHFIKRWYESGELKSEGEDLAFHVEIKEGENSGMRQGQRQLTHRRYSKDGAVKREVKAILPSVEGSNWPKPLQEFIAKTSDGTDIPDCGTVKDFYKNKTLGYEGTVCGEWNWGGEYFSIRNKYSDEKIFNPNGVLLVSGGQDCPSCPLVVKHFWEDGKLKAESSKMNWYDYNGTLEYRKTLYLKYWAQDDLRFHRHHLFKEGETRSQLVTKCWNVEGYPKGQELYGWGCEQQLQAFERELNSERGRLVREP